MTYADLILKNARIITLDENIPEASLAVIKNSKIIYIGNNDSLQLFNGQDTKVIDCKNKIVIPGFIDGHGHFFSFIRKLVGVDLSFPSVRSIEDIKETIHERALKSAPGQWIEGTGYNEFYLDEKRHPNRYDLDKVAPGFPVVVAHSSLHFCVLNSMALKLAGINKYSQEGKGVRIESDETGEPTGLLFEMLGYIREKVMPPISTEDAYIGASLVNEQLLSSGITSLQDASITNDLKRWKVLDKAIGKGIVSTRLTMTAGTATLTEFIENGITPGYGGDRYKLFGVKIIPASIDGRIFPLQSQLNRMVLRLQEKGYPVLIHAISREMVESVVIAFEYVKKTLGNQTPMQRIEHCSECSFELIERLVTLNPVIVSQPLFVYYNGDRYHKVIPEENIPWLYRFKSIYEAGLKLAAGSDLPVVPHNPLVGIYAAVTRNTERGQKLNYTERILPGQALKMYTVNAAYAAGEQDIKSSLTPGKLADMVVLSQSPLTVAHDKIKDIKVEMTIVGGKVVWEINSKH